MMKKVTMILLAMLFCVSLAFSVSAAPTDEFIIDELGCLTENELDELNELASDIYDSSEIGIFFVFTEAETLEDYDIEQILNGITDYVVMMENETSWYTFYGGRGETIDSDTEEYICMREDKKIIRLSYDIIFM